MSDVADDAERFLHEVAARLDHVEMLPMFKDMEKNAESLLELESGE